MTTYVWVTMKPEAGCQCWRDAVCSHGWTWQEEPLCVHENAFQDVHESLADAVRALYPIVGSWEIGPLLRELDGWRRVVYVMPAGSGPFVDDHDAADGPAPLYVIQREPLVARSTPRADLDGRRRMADQYRVRGDRQ